MKQNETAHNTTVATDQNGGRNHANGNPRAMLPGETLSQAVRRLDANGALFDVRSEATASARGAAHVRYEAAHVPEQTKISQVTKVPQDFKDTDDPQETEDFEDTKDTKDTQEPEDTTKDTTKMATKSATNSQFARKVLVELGRKYSGVSFNERRAFQLASNVKALEAPLGEFSFELRKIAFDAAAVKIKPDRQFSLLAAYMSAFKRVKNAMRGNTIITALNNVVNLGLYELPEILGYPLAGEKHKRILALHREMSRLSDGKEYYLSRRAMQEAARGKMSRYEVLNVCELFEALGLIKIVDRGKSGKGQGKGAARYRYIAPSPESDSDQDVF